MEIKILQVFYDKNGLPYKDKERQVHFPIVGNAFQGASNTTKIRFYYNELDMDNETTFVAVSKLPNGKVGSKILNNFVDEELNENYALLELDSFYTQVNGDLFISLQGYQGGVRVEQDEQGIYQIYGTPTIQATGSIKLSINYATQFVGSGEEENVTLQRIFAYLGTKLGIRATTELVSELPTVGQTDVFYAIYNDPQDTNKLNIYVWNETTQEYVWVGDNTLDLGDYYTQEQGEQFEQEINTRVESIASGSPKGVYSTLADLQAAYPTGTDGIYLVTSNGHWYYWNGSAWTDGGAYQAAVDIDYDTVNERLDYLEENIRDFTNSINLYNGTTIFYGGWSGSTITADDTQQKRIAFIKCKPNTTYYIVRDVTANNFGRIGYTTSDEITNGTSVTALINDLGGAHATNVTTGADAKYLLFYYTYQAIDVFIQITEEPRTTLTQNTYPVLKDNVYDKKEINDLLENTTERKKKCKFSKNGTAIYIYMPSKKSTNYIRFKYMLYVDAATNMNQWKVMDTDVVDSNLNLLFNLYASSNNIEWEGVVKEEGTDDFIGGYHGDETNEYLSVFVDGLPIDISQDYEIIDCEEIKIVNKSILNRCDTPNDNLFTRYKVSTWNKNKYTIRNRWIALQNNISLNAIYMTMLSLPAVKGDYTIAEYGRYDDKYIIQSQSGAAVQGSCLYSSNYAREVEFWGNDFYAVVRAIYNDYNGYSCFCDRLQTNTFKAYFKQANKTFNTNDEINGLSEFEFLF